MNPITFSEILTDIPDSFIESAAEPHSKPIRWYQISAVAACIVLLIAAAVYPKLRIQTSEITEPPAATVTTETTAQNTAETTAVTVYTTAVSQKATHRTTADTVSQTVTETVTAAVTEQDSAPVQTAPVSQSGTEPVIATKQTAVSAEVTETTAQSKQTIPITVRKYTRSIPERPSSGGDVHNPPPGTPESPDEPDSPNEAVKTPVSEEPKAKIVDYFDYYSVSFYDITADAALLSGQYDGRILSLQFLRLEYDPADGIPLIEETVELQLDLPENLKGHIEEVRADVSVTTDAAAFADVSKQEPEIIYIPRKEDDL